MNSIRIIQKEITIYEPKKILCDYYQATDNIMFENLKNAEKYQSILDKKEKYKNQILVNELENGDSNSESLFVYFKNEEELQEIAILHFHKNFLDQLTLKDKNRLEFNKWFLFCEDYSDNYYNSYVLSLEEIQESLERDIQKLHSIRNKII